MDGKASNIVTYKVIVCGDFGVGKTTLLRTFADEDTDAPPLPTPTNNAGKAIPSLDVKEKDIVVESENGQSLCVRLRLFDTAGTCALRLRSRPVVADEKRMRAGEERFKTLSSNYYRGSAAVVLMYSIDSKESYKNILEGWTGDLNRYVRRGAVRALVGTKSDLDAEREVETHDARDFATSMNWPHFFETSSSDRESVDAVFRAICKTLLSKFPPSGRARRASLMLGKKKSRSRSSEFRRPKCSC